MLPIGAGSAAHGADAFVHAFRSGYIAASTEGELRRRTRRRRCSRIRATSTFAPRLVGEICTHVARLL
eukprot:12987332-Alexandrium_andersonii.AAC.1